MANAHTIRQSLRQTLKDKRKHLSVIQCQQAAQKVAQQIMSWDFFQQAQHIAYYFPYNNEIDLTAVWHAAEHLGKKNYFPAVQNEPDPYLIFLPYRIDQPLKNNRFGIAEPTSPLIEAIAVTQLDVVFIPLVSFDITGNRLGMGAGYYDRTFESFLQHRSAKPLLIGVGYECQRVEKIPAELWDIKLNAIITEQNFYWSSIYRS